MRKKIKIYLASLSHNYACNGPFTHPLNLGYLSSYAKKYYSKSEELDIRLFVYPNDILDEIKKDPPDILGLASYTWNDNLNHQILKHVKKNFPKSNVVNYGLEVEKITVQKIQKLTPLVPAPPKNRSHEQLTDFVAVRTRSGIRYSPNFLFLLIIS